MKERLDQYTMSQFIDIACGDYSHIGADDDTAKHVAVRLMEQYSQAADPASAKARLLEEEKTAKTAARIKLYRILLNLINVFDAYDEVKDILTLAGVGYIIKSDDDSLKVRIGQMLRTEESRRDRMEKERQADPMQNMSEADVRASFDRQTARLMTHFKFAISHETISASVYANLVNTACRNLRHQKG